MNSRRFLPTALLCLLTALSISACGSDKPSSPEAEDASLPPVEADSGVPGEEDASVTDPDAGPGDECEAPSCTDDNLQYCKEGRWTSCTGTDVCREGSCIPKPVCEPGVCSEDSVSICSPQGQWTPCGGVCENGACSECADNTCSEDGSKECILGHWSECSPSTVCLYETCAAPDCSPNTCSSDENYRCQNGRWTRCELGTACSEGACKPKEGFDSLGYIACTKNSDCSFGICLKELTLSRIVPATGRSKVTIHELDSRIAEGEGVCSMDCTASSSICERIGASQPYTCQLAWTGVSPYPVDAELPIETLDLEEMARSIPFSSLCRPAIQKLEAFGASFCASCDSDESCGEGFACATEQTRPPPSGSCVKACSKNADCPLGFQCGALSDGRTGTWCLPIQGTCGSCLDRDHDLMGLGQCLLSGVDCDDSDEDASFSTGQPPICEPGRDRNCNGRDDRPELLGTKEHCTECGAVCDGEAEGFANASKLCLDDPEAETGHICATSCHTGYGDCNGDLQSPESNGCEIDLFKVGLLYGLDEDGDGYPAWDPQREETRLSLKYCCPEAEDSQCWAEAKKTDNQIVWGKAREDDKTWRKIKTGYSSKDADCDDNRADTHPGADETCNALDDNCDGEVDNSVVSVLSIGGHDYRVGEACLSGLDGVCGTGITTCDIINGEATMYCLSDSNGTDEVCNAQDDNCNGATDEGIIDAIAQAQGGSDACALAADVRKEGNDALFGICREGHWKCGAYTDSNLSWEAITGNTAHAAINNPNGVGFIGVHCELNEAETYDFYGDKIDSNCDGFDGDLTHGIFVAAGGGSACSGSDSNPGSSQAPFQTLTKALQQACSRKDGKLLCQDIFLAASQSSTSSYVIPRAHNADTLHEMHTERHPNSSLIRIYGGMSMSCSGTVPMKINWTTSSNNTSVSVTNSSLTSYGSTVTAMTGVKGSVYRPMSLTLENIELSLSNADGLAAGRYGQTMAAIACPIDGCSDLKIHNSSIKVTASAGATGTSYTTAPGNNSSFDLRDYNNKGKNGVDAYDPQVEDEDQTKSMEIYGSKKLHETTYLLGHNLCRRGLYNENSHLWTDDSSSVFYSTYMCPDKAIPWGGCGGYRCSKNGCGNVNPSSDTNYSYTKGRPGGGPLGGEGDDQSIVFGGGNCDSYIAKKNELNAGNGADGAGGTAGTISSAKLTLRYDTGNLLPYFYFNNTNGNGGVGTSGSGGGGGAVLRAYTRKGSNDYWVFGGSGGNGGCGGRAGGQGGTGGTGIGILMISPQDTESSGLLDLDANTMLTIVGGAGGAGGDGEGGATGGAGGAGYGYKHTSSGDLTHCHVGTPGGRGGSGGGGGGGAGGHGGNAIGIMYGCTRSGIQLSKITLAEGGNQMGCGIEISNDLYKEFHCYSELNKRIILTKGIGKDSGTQGTAGKVEGSGNLQNPTGGTGGTGGTKDSTANQGVAMEFMYVQGITTTPPTNWPSNVPYTMTPTVLDYQE